MSKEEILESISNMTVMEVVELISDMEEKFGVTAAAAVAAAPAGGGGEGGAAAEEYLHEGAATFIAAMEGVASTSTDAPSTAFSENAPSSLEETTLPSTVAAVAAAQAPAAVAPAAAAAAAAAAEAEPLLEAAVGTTLAPF